MKRFFRAAALLLTAALFCACLAGCGGDSTWVFESGGEKLPTGLYIIYQVSAVDTAGNQYAEAQRAVDTAFVAPIPSELLKEQLDGAPIANFVSDEALKLSREYYAVKSQFEQRGLALTEDDLSLVESAAASEYASKEDFYVTNGVSEGSVKEFFMDATRRNRLFTAVYGEGGEREVSEDELKARFEENYYLVNLMPVYKPVPAGEDDAETQQELKDVEEFTQKALEDLKGGKPLEDISFEWMQQNAADDAAREALVKPTPESMRFILAEADRAVYGEALLDTIIATKTGEAAIAEDENFYLVFERLDILADETDFDNYESALLLEMRNEEYAQLLTEWSAGIEMSENTQARERYSAAKLDLDMQASAS